MCCFVEIRIQQQQQQKNPKPKSGQPQSFCIGALKTSKLRRKYGCWSLSMIKLTSKTINYSRN